ncbi:MAG: dihydropteroate synthase [Balneolaceae bacterium]
MEAGSKYVILCRNKSIDLADPKIMGVLNTTPDSFSDGGLFVSQKDALERIGQMVEEGADIIDVGGESTRPGADPVSPAEEMNRVLPIIEKAAERFGDVLLSVDTTKYEVARAALEAGVHIVNDISGLQKEPRLAGLCAEYSAGYVLMHSQGDPQTMQKNPRYDDVISDLKHYFKNQMALALNAGLQTLILDPGIGFGKTLEHNLKIIANLDKFTEFGYPILVGASRKSMIGELLGGRPVDDRLTGTIAVHYHSLIMGAKMLRVHDVKEAKDSIRIFNAVNAAKL